MLAAGEIQLDMVTMSVKEWIFFLKMFQKI
jgi:hypothetical protein